MGWQCWQGVVVEFSHDFESVDKNKTTPSKGSLKLLGLLQIFRFHFSLDVYTKSLNLKSCFSFILRSINAWDTNIKCIMCFSPQQNDCQGRVVSIWLLRVSFPTGRKRTGGCCMTQTTAQDLPSSFPTFSLHFNKFIFFRKNIWVVWIWTSLSKRAGSHRHTILKYDWWDSRKHPDAERLWAE